MFHDYSETTGFNEMATIHKVRGKLTETDSILCRPYDVEMLIAVLNNFQCLRRTIYALSDSIIQLEFKWIRYNTSCSGFYSFSLFSQYL
ncbi:MAG: hypothetical protein NPIRA01_38040 [Nitrospirales bacterium]|nr:MAG: hypothetical protein NPIRA01_38040 [Nitrospirales bacterium]